MKSALLFLSLLLPWTASARLGETMEQCDARYGTFCSERPPRFPGSKTRRVYVKDIFRIDVEFNDQGKAWVVLFRQGASYHLEQLQNPALDRKNDFNPHSKASDDKKPFDKIDWMIPNYKDTEAAEKKAQERSTARDQFAIRAAANIHEMPSFFGAFYVGFEAPFGPEERLPGMARLIYNIFQANAGEWEWRDNATLRPLKAPTDGADISPWVRFDEGGRYPYNLSLTESSFAKRSLHRSDREALACQYQYGLAFWTREADKALLAYSERRMKEIEEWSKKRGSKF